MKLPIAWLKEYIDPKLATDELIQRLTMAGLEVEAVHGTGNHITLELEITPNRADCLSILGLAREIGAITGRRVYFPKNNLAKAPKGKVAVAIDDKNDCGRYIATLIDGVKVAASPAAMAQHLTAMDLRPISNVVDITNFVMMETGQPLHAFDYDKIEGGCIVVRRAKAGEKIITIDGIERKLDPSILIIADAIKPIAIAGIMGGKDTEVTASTKRILLETAYFDMGIIRRACRQLGLRSDSSYRFERNVDAATTHQAAHRATALILELAGGKVMNCADVSLKAKSKRKPIKFALKSIEALLGTTISGQKVKTMLKALGFGVSGSGAVLNVTPPSWRRDVSQPEDLIEEAARIIGYDRLPVAMPMIKATNITIDTRPRQIKKTIRIAMTASGIDEIVTYSMTNTKALVKSKIADMKAVKVFNPLSQDQELMRPSMLPSMLQVAVTNINRGQKDLRFFEIGKRYLSDGERETLGVLLTGQRHRDWRMGKKESVDFFDLKGAVTKALEAVGVNVSLEPLTSPAFDASCTANVLLSGKSIGVLAKIHKEVLQQWDIKTQDVYFAAIDLETIFTLPKPTIKYQPISEFPAITRDVSLAVNKDIRYAQIESVCRQNSGSLLKSVQFIEQYLGDKVPPDQKALIFSLVYQAQDRTLREDEVNATHDHIIQSLTQQLNATRR